MSKTVLEIGIYLDCRVKELAFKNLFHFLMDCISDGSRLAKDIEVSKILYDTISYAGLLIPNDVNTDTFTIEAISLIMDSNFKSSYSKEKAAEELEIHKQTLNKWLEIFDEDLYQELNGERKLTFNDTYRIIISLGLNQSKEILSRQELVDRCNLPSCEIEKNLPYTLSFPYKQFIKYPPIYSKNIFDFFEVYEVNVN